MAMEIVGDHEGTCASTHGLPGSTRAGRAILLVLVILAALGGAQVRAGWGKISYTLTIGSLSLEIGEQGSVDLEVTDIEGAIGAWTIDITYDPDIVAAVDCAPRGNSVCDLQHAGNMVRVTGASATGLVNDTTLATITFRCHSVGSSALALTVQGGMGIPEIAVEVQTQDGRISCEEPHQPTATQEATSTATPLLLLPDTGTGAGSERSVPFAPAALASLAVAMFAAFAVLQLRTR